MRTTGHGNGCTTPQPNASNSNCQLPPAPTGVPTPVPSHNQRDVDNRPAWMTHKKDKRLVYFGDINKIPDDEERKKARQ